MTTTLSTEPDLAITEVRAERADAASIVDVFRSTCRARRGAVALRRHDGSTWQATTWDDYERAVAETALGLRAGGLESGDRVGILSGNRPEWHVADLGTLAAGLVTTPLYATSSSSQIAYILRDADVRVCFVEDGQQLAKVLLRRDELPLLERIVVLGTVDGVDDPLVIHLDDLRSIGADRLRDDPEAFDRLAASVDPSGLATLVYTSGTTGPPKGAMITHANVMATLRSTTAIVPLHPTDRFLSFLPLSHITERSVSQFGHVASGGETWFARSLATVPDDLRACRPTLFFAVPRVWEKFRDSITAKAAAAPPPLGLLLRAYLRLAERRGDASVSTLPMADRVRFELLDRTVGRLLRQRLGLDAARLLVSGAAPIHADLLRWFHGIGLPVSEGYGQTEVSLCTSMNPPGAIRIGTVGTPIPGVDVRIADDGEILVRAANVCAGYWKRPDATAELIDADGWLHTGDLGALDADGYLRVLGRKKDLIITAYGKNISPSEIETALRHQALIAQAVVVGDGRPYLTALLTIDADAAAEWAAERGRSLTLESLGHDRDLLAAVGEAVEQVNAGHSHAEGIRRWRLLPRDLNPVEELTPTLKVRRERVMARHADLIEQMYAEGSSS